MSNDATRRINPQILRWARERAALHPDEAASRVGVEAQVLLAWERGAAFPPLAKLREVAALYKRPLPFFFLPQVPVGFTPIHDYRVHGGAEPGPVTPRIADIIRMASERRSGLLNLLEERPDEFPVRGNEGDDAEELGARLRAALGVTLEAQQRRRQPRETLKFWIGAVESLNVLVFQEGRIDDDSVRGLSIPEQPMPVVVLNGGDAPRGRLFTLMHELAHVAMRQSALCSMVESRGIEAYCNRVAAAVLMPRSAVSAEPLVRDHPGNSDWSDADLGAVARRFGVSEQAMLLRLVALGKARQEFYERMEPVFAARYARADARPEGGGGDYWRTFTRDRSLPYIRAIMEAYYDERASTSEVTEYLACRAEHLPKVEECAFGKRRGVS